MALTKNLDQDNFEKNEFTEADGSRAMESTMAGKHQARQQKQKAEERRAHILNSKHKAEQANSK